MPTKAQSERKRENRRKSRIDMAKMEAIERTENIIKQNSEKLFKRKNSFGVNDPTPQEAWYEYKLWRL